MVNPLLFVKKTFILFLLLSFAVCVMYAQSSTTDTSYLKMCVYSLADDSMAGRLAATEYEKKAACWIAEQFKGNKVKPYFRKNYFQSFEWAEDSAKHESVNVIAGINNKADKTIIIGAHYDHIGMGGKRSRSYGKTGVHNGADDNASGVAVMLCLSKYLKKHGNKSYNYVFIAFAAHEPGLFGSEYFCKNSGIEPGQGRLFINLDMIGRADPDDPVFYYATNDTSLQVIIEREAKSGITFKKKELPLGDHSAYEKDNGKVLFITTGIHDDYHKITDDSEKINFAGMSLLSDFIITLIKNLPQYF